ncbi:hypothetical protein GCM10007418_21870 [Halopseudomonas salina]|uniref:Uncharacterized protein n=1 Tax=Halopseudomonas salina TaxID=1323744 RepID=A0ABQ1PS72_9GAMM|nr:hypothetical protein GCM10007418_21870 [Halopseudomonas salina]
MPLPRKISRNSSNGSSAIARGGKRSVMAGDPYGLISMDATTVVIEGAIFYASCRLIAFVIQSQPAALERQHRIAAAQALR